LKSGFRLPSALHVRDVQRRQPAAAVSCEKAERVCCLLREHELPFQAYGDVTFRSKPSRMTRVGSALGPLCPGPLGAASKRSAR
jgi:hypothetical protein